jgi:dTDP-L-rhamnose 4-epimerase
VVHLAAMVGAGMTASDLPLYAGHNDLGTASVLAAMHERGVGRFVQASSMVVYGEGRYTCPRHGDQAPGPRTRTSLESGEFENRCPVCDGPLDWALVDESAPLDPRSSYAASKVAQEHYAGAWARQSPGAAVSLRYHNVYGPGMPRDTPYSGVAAMFRSSLERGEPPVVFEDGGQVRDFVHVDDVARANAVAALSVGENPEGSHVAYNVCSGHPVGIADVARAIAVGAGSGLEPEVTGRFRIGDVRHVVASPQRARDELGFTARIGPAEGLALFATAPLRP